MQASWWLVVAMLVAAPAGANAQAASYIEKFAGWSNDGAFYAITQAGTDEIDLPALCVSRRGDKPASWPKEVPLPDAEDERGCTDTLDRVFEGQDAQAVIAKASGFVVPPAAADRGKHGETVALKVVGDGALVEVTVAQGKKLVGRGYFFLRAKAARVPRSVTAYWRADGLAVAVEAGDPRAAEQVDGYGPPAFLVVIPLDGSAANAARPRTAREQSRALNLEGMKLLTAGSLDPAQRQFIAATEADPSLALAQYNLACVASLRKDSNTAVSAIGKLFDLARSDADARQALKKARTDHDLDFIASQSPYVTQLLGRPRTKGDDWCIAAEKRARDINPGNFIALAEEARPLLDPSAVHAGLPAAKDPEFSCHVRDGQSQLSITMYVSLSDKAKATRTLRIAWEIFPDGVFDADAFVDERQAKTVRLQKLDHVVRISRTIASGTRP